MRATANGDSGDGAAPPAGAWVARSGDLSRWAMDRLVNRTDRCGGYYVDPDSDPKAPQVLLCTRPAKGPESGFLTPGRLARHFRGEDTAHVVGVHSLGPDSHGKWVGVDVDNHDDDGHPGDPEANLRLALGAHGELVRLGFRPLLYESNGKGGYHLLALFSAPVPGPVLFRFGRWLVRDYKAHGMAAGPEVFPKQATLGPGRLWGNWLRVVGRHPKRDFWPRVWSGSDWLEGAAAVELVLSLTGDDPGLVPHEAVTFEGGADEGGTREEAGAGGGMKFTYQDTSIWEVTPWDDFNARANLPALVEPFGWKFSRVREDAVEEWTRPNKGTGTSATFGFCKSKDGRPRFYVWTDGGDPLKQHESYSLNGLNAALHHGGDFQAAWRALESQGYGRRKPTTGGGGAAAAGFRINHGDVTLTPERPRRTDGGKLVVPVLVVKPGLKDRVTVTDSVSGRKGAAKLFEPHLGKDKAGTVVAEVLSWAIDQLAGPAADDGLTVRQVVNNVVPDALGITYRTERGVFSTSRACEITRGEFVGYTPSSLIDLAADAVDAPRDQNGRVKDESLLRAVKSALEVLWADLMHRLTPAADVGGETAAAREFRAAVERLWHSCRTFEITKSKDGDTASRVSLAGTVLTLSTHPQVGRAKWAEVRPNFSAWWRPHVKADGEVTTLLAMRVTLAEQIGVKIPGAMDQESLSKLGESYGAFDPRPPVRDRLSDGTRLAVFTDSLSARILARVVDDPPESASPDDETQAHGHQ